VPARDPSSEVRPSSGWAAWLARLLRRPTSLVLIAIVIAIDFWRIESSGPPPCYSPLVNFVSIGQWVDPSYLGPTRNQVSSRTFRVPAGGIIVQIENGTTPIPAGAKEIRGCAIVPVATWFTGIWGMTTENRGMYLEPNYALLTPAEVAAFPNAVLNALRTAPSANRYAEEISLLAAGRTVSFRPRWQGFVHNAVIVVLSVTLIWGVMTHVAQAVQRSIARRRLAKGRCPRCLYDLAKTPMLCPECGWSRLA